ncbi:hypothetical protein ATC00_12230 [Sinorhizobium americanum]|nr:hypothetical protein ATC00_12230 [Sinorhizobium americanum]
MFLWIAKEWRTVDDDKKKRRDEKEKYIRALFAEIDYNTRDMEKFIELSASVGEVIMKIKENKDFIPHITDSRHKEIYKSQIGLLHHAGDEYIADVVTFYGIMERIGTEIQGVYLPSFGVISENGRASVIDDIVDYAFECAQIGQSILLQMERTYPEYRLQRKKRKAPDRQSDADLQRRVVIFNLDLDRARTAHLKVS